MQKHVKVYRKHFDYGEQDRVPCEVCGGNAVDIHHIVYRSRGGGDTIDNLMALCRYHHDMAHQEALKKEYLAKKHQLFLDTHEKSL
jgi:5-methylcytosine-specific restriction endonuclease McrA